MSTGTAAIERRQLGRLGRLARRRRFRLVRTGALLGVIALIRLAGAMRPRWRLITGVAGFLIEVVGFNVLAGGLQDASSVLGLALLLFALMRDAKQCSSRQAGIAMGVRPPC
jgi:hypothetical protein